MSGASRLDLAPGRPAVAHPATSGRAASRGRARLVALALGVAVAAALPPARVEATSSGASPRTERYSGEARDPSGALAYRETHEVELEGDRPRRSRTIYRDANGGVIAELVSTFPRGAGAPDYRYVDRRTGVVEQARVDGGELELVSPAGSRRIALDTLPRALVLGQGLHHLVRERLDELAAGRTLRVAFALPSRLDTFEFRVRRVAEPAEGVVRLRIEVTNWLLRLLAPSLEVDYELATRRLLRYAGVSNVAGSDGEPREVRITYTYGGEDGPT